METNNSTISSDFVNQLRLYQNANNDGRSVKANFVVRTAEFALIMSDIRQKKANDPVQHELLLGRRGSGKSTLLRRIQIEIDEDSQLSQRYLAINLAEEQAGIYRLSDLWYETLQEISRRCDRSLSLSPFSSFASEQDYTRYLYTEIHRLLAERGKRAVLLLDNIDRILENVGDDGHLLREFLLNYQDVQLIGGSTRMSEHFWQYDQPFYEFFRVQRLEALSFEDIHLLLNQWAAALDLPQLHDYALRNRGRIEALRILTDGLPRTLQFFIRVFLQNSALTGFDHIRQTMDLASPLYQERLNNLTPPQRKIVLEMAFLWEACSTRQLVDVCRMEGKLISSFLKQLTELGLVETLKTKTKNHLYRLSERFFNMWLIMTQGNPHQKRRARYLTIFLETWYDAAQIKALTNDHISKLSQAGMGYDQAVVLSKAFSQSRYVTTAQRDYILTLTHQLPGCDPRIGDLPESYNEISNRIVQLIDQGKFEEALHVVGSVENEEDGVKFFIKGYLHSELGEMKKAETFYLRAIDKGEVKALHNLASLYDDQGDAAKAEAFYLRAIDKGDVKALFNLALLYADQREADKAETFYLRAIDKGEVNALNNLASLYANQGETVEAEALYLQAIDKGDVNALHNLALLYKTQGKTQKAEIFYLRAIDKGFVEALNNLALLYDDQGDAAKAEAFYLRAIDKGDVKALFNLALSCFMKNAKKQKALILIQHYTQQETDDLKGQSLQLVIELWNDLFVDIDKRAKWFLTHLNSGVSGAFLEFLLWLEQTQLVHSFFEDEKIGVDLQEAYTPLYYAVKILSDQADENFQLRIPPDVTPTVNIIVEQVREKQAFYNQEPKAELEVGAAGSDG
ncbi:tetratricopeptide repeat protein [Fibrella sp. WM1]|uniref:tetratricopeptide repeat protein n=1 Tax=Fibrella musci TaxID=3242485 RepID=UPI003521594E